MQIFDTEPAEGLRPPPASVSRFDAAAIASVSPSGVHPMPNQVIYQSRVGSQEQALAAYATIPARGAAHGPSLRSSSSQDQLAQLASGPVQLRYQVPYPPAASHRLGPAPHFPPAPLPGPSPHPYETPINGTRPARPLAVYQPWNSTSHQPPFVQALDVASPSSSGSSSDSGTHPPNFQTPSSSPSNAVFYACGPTRPPPQPLRQAPDPPLPVAPSQSSSLSPQTGRRVRALYNCVGENPAELSFEPNAIIMNGLSTHFPDIPVLTFASDSRSSTFERARLVGRDLQGSDWPHPLQLCPIYRLSTTCPSSSSSSSGPFMATKITIIR